MADRRSYTGWGRTAPTVARPVSVSRVDELAGLVAAAADRARTGADGRGLIARGLGRSYGDAAQNAGGTVLELAGLNEIGEIGADGSVSCGAAVSLDQLLARALPRGWFLPVTPGTRFVSLGGAVSADIHGKNHHRDGSLADHLTGLEIVDGLGARRSLAPDDPLFWAVAGGMGLVAVITSVTLRLRRVRSGRLTVRTSRSRDLQDTMRLLEESDRDAQYTVAWVDCLAGGGALGRGVVTAAAHRVEGDLPADQDLRPSRPLPVPALIPGNLLNRHTVAAFNECYYRAARPGTADLPCWKYFYPLDVLAGWNRLYGRAGFVQYQFVTPDPADVEWVIQQLQRRRVAGFLAVLKRFGPGNRAPLSFPAAGWTLAVDIPARLPGLAALLDRFDERVAAAGGRVYLAKDSRLSPAAVRAMYPRLPEWQALRDQADPHRVFVSDLSRRLAL